MEMSNVVKQVNDPLAHVFWKQNCPEYEEWFSEDEKQES